MRRGNAKREQTSFQKKMSCFDKLQIKNFQNERAENGKSLRVLILKFRVPVLVSEY